MATDKLPIDDLPGDLPEDWKLNDAVTPTGTDAGLSDKHGYNYLMKAVNAAHKKLNALIKALRDNLHAIAYSGSYNDLLNKPSTFPPRTHTHTKVQITDFPTSLPANGGNADTVPWSGVSNKPSVYPPESHSHTPSQVGLGNVSNDAQVKRSEMGVANGVATLDTGGKVPSSQLPSFVDDVLEYTNKASFPSAGESGKIYVDKATNITWRWSGTAYVEISASLALGETSSTAYSGASGKATKDALDKVLAGTTRVPNSTNATSVPWSGISSKPTTFAPTLGETSGTAYDGGKGKVAKDMIDKITNGTTTVPKSSRGDMLRTFDRNSAWHDDRLLYVHEVSDGKYELYVQEPNRVCKVGTDYTKSLQGTVLTSFTHFSKVLDGINADATTAFLNINVGTVYNGGVAIVTIYRQAGTPYAQARGLCSGLVTNGILPIEVYGYGFIPQHTMTFNILIARLGG